MDHFASYHVHQGAHEPDNEDANMEPYRVIFYRSNQHGEVCMCSECGESFARIDDCCEHIFDLHCSKLAVGRSHSKEPNRQKWRKDDETGKYYCVACRFPSNRAEGVNRHYRAAHVIGPGKLECPYCAAFWTANKNSYNQHLTLCDAQGGEPHPAREHELRTGAVQAAQRLIPYKVGNRQTGVNVLSYAPSAPVPSMPCHAESTRSNHSSAKSWQGTGGAPLDYDGFFSDEARELSRRVPLSDVGYYGP